ncbi:hypothetical protein Micbo1qcDRAFT_166924 [Microdochium bolleyi]|uniref:Cora-like Mg2+ transporter protein-domain-containing protein n=1 Tax=Microdochium bolleyi TaxID=196109 RepID=A0A136ITM7_9PEZI|nr:hypothetical protein Micbo1qcDRAFT_166924 [Microdochium bolleyi]
MRSEPWSASSTTMDWVRDSYGLSATDLDNIFRYGSGGAQVLHLMESDKIPSVLPLREQRDIRDWSERICPKLSSTRAGLVLLLLNHPGKTPSVSAEKIEPNGWPDHSEVAGEENEASVAVRDDRRAKPSLKLVPFDQPTFEKIADVFHVHGSIARTISRADAPVISRTRTVVEEHGNDHEAWIYNVRTTNAWESDRAMTATYFPHNGLTFGVVFGCQAVTAAEIIKRLELAGQDALHPLIVPGILIELERQRHIDVAEHAINEIETRIYQLNPRPDTTDIMDQADMEVLHREKRSKWLDMTYLRNCLASWNDQLTSVGLYLTEIDSSRLQRINAASSEETLCREAPSDQETWQHGIVQQSSYGSSEAELYSGTDTNTPIVFSVVGARPPTCWDSCVGSLADDQSDTTPVHVPSDHLKKTSFKIRVRVHALIKEYDNLIRDCTMRIDGMSMATQWAQGETNMEIAKATSRESKHMRSISLVTMVFLPGTFFAGMFSTTFFQWHDGEPEPQLSSYFWVYIVITVLCTMLTLGLWYYFNVFRRRMKRSKDEYSVSVV